jgi:hypothetical protein
VFDIEYRAMDITYICWLNWCLLFQHIFDGIFAAKRKRVMRFVNLGNIIDFMIFFVGLFYIVVVYKDFRYNTFLEELEPDIEAERYFLNWRTSPINEPALLSVYLTFLWLKVASTMKLISIFGQLIGIVERLIEEILTFTIFFCTQLFLFGIIGVVLFPDSEDFNTI